MQSKRSWPAACSLDDVVFVAGGYDGSTVLDTVECYNPSTNSWQPAASMTSRRAAHALVALNGRLFAYGGSDGWTYLKTAEYYDVTARKWVATASMSVARYGVAGVGMGVSSAKRTKRGSPVFRRRRIAGYF